MRTKALFCAAALAAGVVTSMAQVYSQNIVGYANVTVRSAFDIASNPFNNGSNGADVVLPATDSSQVLLWSGVGFNTYTFDSGFGGWIDPDFNPAVPTLAPGVAFFYYNPSPSPAVLTFTGNVAGNAGQGVNNHIGPAFQLIASKVPFSGAVDAAPISLPVQDSMQVLQWGGLSWNTVTYDSGFGGWIDPDFNNVPAPTVGIGQGFFYYNPNPAGCDWWQTVPAN